MFSELVALMWHLTHVVKTIGQQLGTTWKCNFCTPPRCDSWSGSNTRRNLLPKITFDALM